MTPGEYSNLLTRCAQALYTGVTKQAAKDAAATHLVGIRIKVAGTCALACDTLRYTTHASVVATMPMRCAMADAAYECFLEDVRARIDTL